MFQNINFRIKYSLLLLVAGITLLMPALNVKAYVSDSWYDTNWTYRRAVNITGSNVELTDYQVKLNVSYEMGKMKSDFSDLRFTGTDGVTLCSYYIESETDSVSAIIWVKVNSIPVAGTHIYMYYGNSNAISTSSGDSSFSIFDHFDNNIIDPEWTVINPDGNQTISENMSSVSLKTAASISDLALSTGNQNAPRIIQGATGNFVVETKITTTNASYDLTGILLWKDSQNFYVFGKGMLNGSERIWRRKNINNVLSDTYYGGAYTPDTVYLRLIRNGNTLTCYYSDDVSYGTWTQVFLETFDATDPISVGFVRFDTTARTNTGLSDWFLVRKYISAELVTSLGEEELAPEEMGIRVFFSNCW